MDPVVLRALLVVGLVVLATIVGWWWRRRDGVVRTEHGVWLAPSDLEAVGLDLTGARAGAVLVGSPSCAPCESARQVLGDVADGDDGFTWVYADANDHAALARSHAILRVPTVLVVGSDGRVLARSSGVPRTDELRQVLHSAA